MISLIVMLECVFFKVCFLLFYFGIVCVRRCVCVQLLIVIPVIYGL